jgi:hypothetical protein
MELLEGRGTKNPRPFFTTISSGSQIFAPRSSAFLFTLPIFHVSFNEGLGEARGILLMRARGVNEAGALITIRFFESQPGTHLAARRVSGRTL